MCKSSIQTQVHPETDTITMVSPTAFTLFPNLPPELRLQIWRCSLPAPRIVHFLWCRDEAMIVHHKSPVAFFVNRESRAEALMRFTFRFVVEAISTVDTRQFLLNPSCDTLLLDQEHLDQSIDMISPQQRDRIRHLAIESRIVGDIYDGSFQFDLQDLADLMGKFHRLKTMAIAVNGILFAPYRCCDVDKISANVEGDVILKYAGWMERLEEFPGESVRHEVVRDILKRLLDLDFFGRCRFYKVPDNPWQELGMIELKF
jgi:hypothetical protein